MRISIGGSMKSLKMKAIDKKDGKEYPVVLLNIELRQVCVEKKTEDGGVDYYPLEDIKLVINTVNENNDHIEVVVE